jgi:hypothetical protein
MDSSERHAAVQLQIQSAISEVADADLGDDLGVVAAALDLALADRGMGEQPRPWAEAVARSVVIGGRTWSRREPPP